MSDRARANVLETIADRGPIGFDAFMELALYGPGGFYEEPPIGAERDFVTSPHVHPVFAQLLGAAIMEFFDALGRPEPFRIAEVGAGDGKLASQLLDGFSEIRVEYLAVERSPGARRALEQVTGIGVADELGRDPHVVLANELLDNLPFRRLRGGREALVGSDGERLVEVCDGTGEERVDPVGALAFVDRVAEVLTAGFALLIDYGGIGDTAGPAHGYRAHRVVADVLEDPGDADITVGVDFALIAERAEARGLVAFPPISQERALLALGFGSWLAEELERQREHLDERRGVQAVRTWSGRSRATLLVDPSALGRLRWLVLATPGLPAPRWLVTLD